MPEQNKTEDKSEPDILYEPASLLLDHYHHDLPERHTFGQAFHLPVDPQPIGATAFPGISDTPAREDHVHAGIASGGNFFGQLGTKTLTTTGQEILNGGMTAVQATGFHVSSPSRVMCDVAGRYLVYVHLSGQSTVATAYVGVNIWLYHGGGTTANYESVNGGTNANWWEGADAFGVFQMVVGDEIELSAYTNVPNITFDTRSWIAISPLTGAKGDKGDTGATGSKGDKGDTGAKGDTGPQGPPGASGSAAGTYRYVQMSPASTWDVVHNLPYWPNVTVVDSLGREIVPDVQYVSGTEIQLIFSASVAGEAYFS